MVIDIDYRDKPWKEDMKLSWLQGFNAAKHLENSSYINLRNRVDRLEDVLEVIFDARLNHRS